MLKVTDSFFMPANCFCPDFLVFNFQNLGCPVQLLSLSRRFSCLRLERTKGK